MGQKLAFRHVFSFAPPAAAVYIPHGDHFPLFEPDVTALGRARLWGGADGYEARAAAGREGVNCEE